MKVKQLVHLLTAEYVDQDDEIRLWAYEYDGDYSLHTVADVTSTDGVADLEIRRLGDTPKTTRPAI